MALKKRKVPVEMVRYPRSTHDLSRTGEPWLLVDRLERHVNRRTGRRAGEYFESILVCVRET